MHSPFNESDIIECVVHEAALLDNKMMDYVSRSITLLVTMKHFSAYGEEGSADCSAHKVQLLATRSIPA